MVSRRNLLIGRPEVPSPFPWYMRAHAATTIRFSETTKNSDRSGRGAGRVASPTAFIRYAVQQQTRGTSEPGR